MRSYLSPAKVNLFLRVLERRSDGYHNIASLLQAIDLFDTLTFAYVEKDLFTCTDPKLEADSNNLVLKAVRIFRQETGWTNPLSIHLQKNIPYEAGLGGGSGNAATTLYALSEVSGLNIPVLTLKKWGSQIGMDVPFFFSEGLAYCTERGDVLASLPPLPSQMLTLIKPDFGLLTPLVYKTLDVNSLSKKAPEKALEAIQGGKLEFFNDLEVPAFSLRPELEVIKNELLACGFSSVTMSGSGTCFFCTGTPSTKSFRAFKTYQVRFLTKQPGKWYK